MSEVKDAPVDEHLAHFALEQQTRHLSRSISNMCVVAVILSIGCAVIMAVALFIAVHMPLKTRALLATGFGTAVFAMLMVLACSRQHPATLNTFTGLLLFVSGICAGVAIGVV